MDATKVTPKRFEELFLRELEVLKINLLEEEDCTLKIV